jgi:hypothetical protein
VLCDLGDRRTRSTERSTRHDRCRTGVATVAATVRIRGRYRYPVYAENGGIPTRRRVNLSIAIRLGDAHDLRNAP